MKTKNSFQLKTILLWVKKHFVYVLLTILFLALLVFTSFGYRNKIENIGTSNFICLWDGSAPVIQFDVKRTRTWKIWILKTKDELDFSRGGVYPEGCYCQKLDIEGKCEWY